MTAGEFESFALYGAQFALLQRRYFGRNDRA